ncbi:MAG: Xaa-Pro peptidase family protein [Oscillospiraceae bacterium]|nr:Xaa-Pro peptidase family protein [Oscillospiraceae bacterium]
MQSLQNFRAERGQAVAVRHELDAYILSLPENIEYFSGYFPFTMTTLYSAESYLVYDPYSKKKALIVSASDVPTIMEEGFDGSIFVVGSFQFYNPGQSEFADKLRDILRKRYSSVSEGIIAALNYLVPKAKRVLFDESRTPIGTWRNVAQALPDTTFVDGAMILREIKCIKHPDEIAGLKTAAHIAEDALMSAISYIRPGVSEYDIESDYIREVALRHSDPYFFVATADERAAFSDTFNRTTQIIHDGSMIRFDFGCIWQRYRSDLARTVVVGENRKAEDYYAAVLEGQSRAIDAIKPGVTAGEIFDIAVTTVRKSGIPHYERHHCGHGIGLATYDLPSIAPGNNTQLEEGMVLCIETPYYEIGWGGVQVEDTIAVTKTGAEYLTRSPRTLIKV